MKGPITTSEDAIAISNKPNVGWEYGIRIRFEVFMDILRMLTLISLIAMYIIAYLPTNRILAVDTYNAVVPTTDSEAKQLTTVQFTGGERLFYITIYYLILIIRSYSL